MKTEKEVMLYTKGLTKVYDNGRTQNKVLNNVSVSFESGSVNLIYGRSGSGKTTLLNMLAGLDAPSYGDIYFNNKRYNSMDESGLARLRGSNFGFVFQAYHLIPGISVKENIICPSNINNTSYDKEYYDYLLERLGLINLIGKKPYELSGGEQQRVAIARAMILKPQIVFADEPTGNLDTENTKIITDLFCKMNEDYKTTLIIVTHEEDLLACPDQVIRLKDGEAVSE